MGPHQRFKFKGFERNLLLQNQNQKQRNNQEDFSGEISGFFLVYTVFFMNSSISALLGDDGCAPIRVTEIAAAALAN